jgi:hypothetical protein
MQYRQHPLAPLLRTGLCALLLLGALALVRAEDKKVDPTGTWVWTTPGRGGGPERKFTLKLKIEDNKLIGKLITPGRGDQTTETEIKEGKIKGEEFSFTITREMGGNTMVTKYTGKLTEEGNIKGKIVTEREGKAPREREWEAKPEKKKEAPKE